MTYLLFIGVLKGCMFLSFTFYKLLFRFILEDIAYVTQTLFLCSWTALCQRVFLRSAMNGLLATVPHAEIVGFYCGDERLQPVSDPLMIHRL